MVITKPDMSKLRNTANKTVKADGASVKIEVSEEEDREGTQTNQSSDEEKKQYIKQIAELKTELESLRKENEMLRNQQQKMGITAETVDKMKKELDRARSTNKFLLDDVKDRKKQVRRLEIQMFELNMRIEAATKKMGEIAKISEKRKVEIEELTQQRDSAFKFVDENNKLRKYLFFNHIDYKTGEPINGAAGKKRQSTFKNQNIGNVTVRETKKSKSRKEMNDKLLGTSKSLEDIRNSDEFNDTSSTCEFQECERYKPPAYLGRYTEIIHNRRKLHRKLASSVDSSTNKILQPRITLAPFRI